MNEILNIGKKRQLRIYSYSVRLDGFERPKTHYLDVVITDGAIKRVFEWRTLRRTGEWYQERKISLIPTITFRSLQCKSPLPGCHFDISISWLGWSLPLIHTYRDYDVPENDETTYEQDLPFDSDINY